MVTESEKKYEDRRDSFHEIARAGGAGGQATKNKGPGGKPQGLVGGISLQPHALDGFGLTKLLLGYEDLAR